MGTLPTNDVLRSEQDWSVVPATTEHLDAIVSCHKQAFPAEFMTLIGGRFLRGFYKFYVGHPDGIVLVALDKGRRVIGLVAGGKPELRQCFTHRQVPLYSCDILWAALTHRLARRRLSEHFLAALKHLFRRVRRSPMERDSTAPPTDPPGTWASLLSVGTVPGSRGHGVGKTLLEAFRAESRARGYETIRLSVHLDNDSAIRLYRRCGWEEVFRNSRGVYFRRRTGGPI